ncbi:MAG TPA: hypothetical protein VF677_07345 [Flavobacterium sp.]|jgi:hypothetical protein
MKRLFSILSLAILLVFSGCTGDDGALGPVGPPGPESEVFEITNVNFTATSYTIRFTFPRPILDSDHVLIYRLAATDQGEDVWRLLPQTYFSPAGSLDFKYNYDFTRLNTDIFLEGNDLATLTDQYRINQVFRIVVVPGFSRSRSSIALDLNDYNAVIKAYGINDKNRTIIKL